MVVARAGESGGVSSRYNVYVGEGSSTDLLYNRVSIVDSAVLYTFKILLGG
jgi:hypothetical protein